MLPKKPNKSHKCMHLAYVHTEAVHACIHAWCACEAWNPWHV